MISGADPQRRHRRAAFALFVLIAFALPQCSSCPANRRGLDASTAPDAATDSGASDASVDAGPADTFALFCFNYTRAVCAWLVVCNRFFDDSQGDCEAFDSRALCDTSWGNSVGRGYLAYDPAAGAACLAGLQDFTRCDPSTTQACSAALHGTSAVGNPCFTAMDCLNPGNACVGAPCNMTCQARDGGSGAGAACATATDCAASLICDSVYGTCEAPHFAVAGEPCTSQSAVCIDGLACRGAAPKTDAGAGIAGVCKATQLGDPCQSGSECPLAVACVASDGGGTCAAPVVGSPCTNDLNCPAGDYCLAGTCAVSLPAGAGCTGASWEECAAPNVCRLVPDAGFVCANTVEIGVPCVDDRSCVPPLVCVASACSWAGETTQPCSHNAPPCFGGACDADAGVCGPAVSNGQPCGSPIDCTSVNCVAGLCVPACP